MTRERDTQRAKLYAAERFAFMNAASKGELAGRPGAKWYTDGSVPTSEAAQAYVDAALQHPAIRATFGRSACRKVSVYFGGRGGSASPSSSRIRLGTECRSQWVALHELAHLITCRYFDDAKYQTASHGAQFAAVYLLLVRSIMGDAPANDLRAAFELYGVRFVKMWEPKE